MYVMATRRVFTLDSLLCRGSYGTCFRRRRKAEFTACTRRLSRAFLLATRCTGLSACGTCLYTDFLPLARAALLPEPLPVLGVFREVLLAEEEPLARLPMPAVEDLPTVFMLDPEDGTAWCFSPLAFPLDALLILKATVEEEEEEEAAVLDLNAVLEPPGAEVTELQVVGAILFMCNQ